MATLQELLAQREELNRLIDMQQSVARTEAIAQIKRIMAENGLTAADIAGSGNERSSGATKSPRKGGIVAAKYKDNQGNTWSGRGLQPRWLKSALAGGAKLQDFAI